MQTFPFLLFFPYSHHLKLQRGNCLGGLPKEMWPYRLPARTQRPKPKTTGSSVRMAAARGIMFVLLCCNGGAVFCSWKDWGIPFQFKNYSNLQVKLAWPLISWHLTTASCGSLEFGSSEWVRRRVLNCFPLRLLLGTGIALLSTLCISARIWRVKCVVISYR